jgi:predicted amidohydrolase
MLSIGAAQTRNSTEVQNNFASIVEHLKKFEREAVDLILFPECSLSGCSAKMKACTREFLSEYLQSMQSWVNDTGIDVVLPTAIVEAEGVYNSAF